MSVVWIVVIAVAMAAFGYLAGLLSGSLKRNRLSSRLAFTEAQLQSALDKVEEISRVDAGLLAQAKEEAAKQVAGVKEDAARQLADAKEEAAGLLETTKGEYAARMAEAKEEASKQLAEVKEAAAGQLAATRDEAAKHLAQAKEEASKQLAETKALADRQLSEAKEEAAKQLAAVKEESAKKLAETKEEYERMRKEAAAQQQKNFDETIAKVQAQMRSATDDMLKQRQKEFAEASNKDLGGIVNPLKETIDRMKEEMNRATVSQTEMRTEIKTNMENMMRQSKAAQESADELARAFKHGTKAQGDWGETVLKELLDSQGLQEGIHYEIQAVIKDAAGNVVKPHEGSSLRPDVILHIDSAKDVIIDSKVSLTAFMDYVNAEDEPSRQAALKNHIASIRKHVDELAKKDYTSYVKAPRVTMDYVIMFVPHTGALWSALNAEPSLWRSAMEKGVFITDEMNLYAALRIVSMTWTSIKQAENHEKIFDLATEMMDRVGQFVKKYDAIGKALSNAQSAYDDGYRKLSPSGQSILQTCSKLTRLGARQSRTNPLPMIADAGDGEGADLA